MNRTYLPRVDDAHDSRLPDLERRRRGEPPVALRRSDVWEHVIDGHPIQDSWAARLRAWGQAVTTSRGERDEAALIERLLASPRPTRANVITAVSPKGGVGKTMSAFVLGNTLAEYRNLAVLCVDANRDYGTLASLAPDELRVALTLSDLLEDLDQVRSRAELGRYVTQLPSGLHILAAPRNPEAMAELTAELYGQLLEFVARFYDVIILDLGTGIIDELTQFGLQRADQALLVTEPKVVTSQKVLEALRYLNTNGGWETHPDGDPYGRLSVVINSTRTRRRHDHHERAAIERAFRGEGIARHVAVPYDDQLERMLDTATYTLNALQRRTRMPIKQLAVNVSHRLV